MGYSFGLHWFKKNGKWYLGASPSKNSMQRFKTKIGDRLVPANVAPWEDVRDERNSMLLDWSHYFSYGATAGEHKHVDWHVYQRARDFLTRRHKVHGRGTARLSCDAVYGELGLNNVGLTPHKRVLNYCGSGVAATLVAYLLHQLGYTDLAVYDNSEWANDESLPIERD